MNEQQAIIDLLDNYAKGRLSADEKTAVEERMRNDESFRQIAKQHFDFTDTLKSYGDREKIKAMMEDAHSEISVSAKVVPLNTSSSRGWKRYWPMTAVAASVALISILGTLYATRSLEQRQKADYKELRRNVDQIRKSQKLMMEDIAETKEKKNLLPGAYAGTGFLISSSGYVATSYHVVKGADSLYIENEKFGSLKAIIVHSDPANDVSILKIEQLSLPQLPYMLTKTETNLAENVYTLGYPREDVVFGEGSVSALTGYKQNPNAYQVSVPVNPGNSGGPLLNSRGDLVGMISGLQTETFGAAFAIKSTVLLNVIESESLDSLQRPIVLPKQNSLKNTSRIQQVKRWKDFVFMVRVYNSN